MKRIEAVIPDHDLRQVLLLISDRAKEIHVYDANAEPLPEIKAEPAKLAAPKAKSGRGGLRPSIGGVSAKERVLQLIRERGTMNAAQLNEEGPKAGYSSSSFGAAACKLQEEKRLWRLPSGHFTIPEEQTNP